MICKRQLWVIKPCGAGFVATRCNCSSLSYIILRRAIPFRRCGIRSATDGKKGLVLTWVLQASIKISIGYSRKNGTIRSNISSILSSKPFGLRNKTDNFISCRTISTSVAGCMAILKSSMARSTIAASSSVNEGGGSHPCVSMPMMHCLSLFCSLLSVISCLRSGKDAGFGWAELVTNAIEVDCSVIPVLLP